MVLFFYTVNKIHEFYLHEFYLHEFYLHMVIDEKGNITKEIKYEIDYVKKISGTE